MELELYILEVESRAKVYGPMTKEAIEVIIERLGYGNVYDINGWRFAKSRKPRVRSRRILTSLELASLKTL